MKQTLEGILLLLIQKIIYMKTDKKSVEWAEKRIKELVVEELPKKETYEGWYNDYLVGDRRRVEGYNLAIEKAQQRIKDL